jgi:nitrogen fixation protein NifB
VQCNFCDRRFDCLNESRPGVTSAVLTPQQAVYYLDRAMERSPAIRVAGIAGPGDPFASPEDTLETLRLVRNRYPKMLLCVASNGLEVAAHAAELGKLQVSHVTLTVNAIDPEIGARIYAWVRPGIRVLRGVDAAAALLERQRAAIVELKQHGDHGQDQHYPDAGDQPRARRRGGPRSGLPGRGHHELHSDVSRRGHAVRSAGPTGS